MNSATHRAAVAAIVASAMAVATTVPGTARALQLANSPWPMYGQNPQLNHRSPYLGPNSGSHLPPIDVPAGVLSDISVTADGLMVLAAGFSHIGIRMDGTLMWNAFISSTPRLSTPVIAQDGTFYVGNRANDVRKHHVSNGQFFCKYRVANIDGDVRGSVVISERYPDRVYFGESGVAGGFFAVRMDPSGEGESECQEIWRRPIRIPKGQPKPPDFRTNLNYKKIKGSPATPVQIDEVPGSGDRKILIHHGPGVIYKLIDHGNDGELVAVRDLRAGGLGPSPIADPATGNIYIGTKKRLVFGLRSSDLSDLWPPVRVDGPIQSTAALSPNGDTVYVLTRRGGIYGIDTQTGQIRPGWPQYVTAGGFFFRSQGPAVDAAGRIFVGDTGERKGNVPDSAAVWAYAPDGTLLWKTDVGGRISTGLIIVPGGVIAHTGWDIPRFYYNEAGERQFVPGTSQIFRFCPPPTGPATARQICGFTIDETVPPPDPVEPTPPPPQ